MAPLNVTKKIVQRHLVEGDPAADRRITLRVDQVLLQDTNGPTSFLQFEGMGFTRLQASRVVAYIDHNILQVDSRNADDHRFMDTVSERYGAIVSKAGNGICHQVHLESFSVPGELLVGTDSHTVTCGAVGMLAFGAGSADVALAMGEGTYAIELPQVVRVTLTGALRPWVTAKDVVLEMIRRFSFTDGTSPIFEFEGPGLAGLSIPQRATIANMGAELGLSTSVFPSDAVTREYFERMGRAHEWVPVAADPDAVFDRTVELDLADVGVLVAEPGAPSRVTPIEAVAGTKIDQVVVGSCTNGSWEDLQAVGAILRERNVSPHVSTVVFPGSRRVLEAMAREQLLADVIAAGAQVAAPGCGACPGLSHVPATNTKSLRTFNRNFPGRSGNRADSVYLCSPLVAAASALTGEITDPRTLDLPLPEESRFPVSFADSPGGQAVYPRPRAGSRPAEVVRGPNIQPLPIGAPPVESLRSPVLLALGDEISTDHISPAGVESLLLRTNVPALAERTFMYVDPTFVERAETNSEGSIVAGRHYGQGSSREAAASTLVFLGVRLVFAVSFARIHRANLINWGIVPLQFERPDVLGTIEQGDSLQVDALRSSLVAGRAIRVRNTRTDATFDATCRLAPRERDVLLAGGLLALARSETTLELGTGT